MSSVGTVLLQSGQFFRRTFVIRPLRIVHSISVTATDQDSVTNSQLTYSVTDHSFSVQTLNNIGYIKTARSAQRSSCLLTQFMLYSQIVGLLEALCQC